MLNANIIFYFICNIISNVMLVMSIGCYASSTVILKRAEIFVNLIQQDLQTFMLPYTVSAFSPREARQQTDKTYWLASKNHQ